MSNYYIERINRQLVILHEEEFGRPITRIEAVMSIAWMKAMRTTRVRKMSLQLYQEALAEMNKDAAGFTRKVKHGRE